MSIKQETQVGQVLCACAALTASISVAMGQSCEPEWDSGRFAVVEVYDDVLTFAVDETPVYPTLYLGGDFTGLSGLQPGHIIGWNGEEWFLLDGGVSGKVNALIMHDDGSGPVLYVGGAFYYAGTGDDQIESHHIAVWNGTAWGYVGLGADGNVRCFAEFDEGSGPVLFAAGGFSEMDGQPLSHIARWDGQGWTDVGGGTNSEIDDLAVYDDGSGPALYAVGHFTEAGGASASHIAKWDGTSWSPLGSGLNLGADALAVHDDGTGEKLYVGGGFTEADGVPAERVARWDGAVWEAVGDGLPNGPTVFETYDSGGGAKLYAGGSFSTWHSGIRCWDGTAWVSVQGQGIYGGYERVEAMTLFDDGSGECLFVGGDFESAGYSPALRLAKWDGDAWSAVGHGLSYTFRGFGQYNDGSETHLAAGGGFRYASGLMVRGVATWNGAQWQSFGQDFSSGTDGETFALTMFDDGSGDAFYIGGNFDQAGDIAAQGVAKWDGTAWSEVGGGVDDEVRALAVFDDGTGDTLFLGGLFAYVGSGGDQVYARCLARWDGSVWSEVGGGIDGPVPLVHVLKVLDDGSGPALFIGGKIQSAAGVACSGLVKWDGVSFTTYGADQLGEVYDVAVYDAGDGPELYAAGDLGDYHCIAVWDGSQWTALAEGLTDPFSGGPAEGYALEVFDRGTGDQLVVAGNFQMAGDIDVNCLAAWDGSRWHDPGGDLNSVARSLQTAGTNDELLYVGGDFTRAGGVPSSRVTVLSCIPDSSGVIGDLDNDGDVDQADLGILLASYGKDDGGDIDGDGDTDQADLGALLGNYGFGL